MHEEAIDHDVTRMKTNQKQIVAKSKATPPPSRAATAPGVRRFGLQTPPDSTTAKGKIFIEAARLFSELGYKKASTRAIASAAGVRQVMINYYYGSKEELYEAVLKYEGIAMLGVIFGSESEHMTLEDVLIGSPLRVMNVLHDNPQWASLLRREIADGGDNLKRALREVSEHGPLNAGQQFTAVYRDAVAAGKAVDLPPDAVRELLLIVGYSVIYLAPLISMIDERDIQDDSVWKEWTTTISTVLRRGLLISPTKPKGK